MPFEKVNPIAEAIELQEMFKDDPEAKEEFRQFELAHRKKELLLRADDMKKGSNIVLNELIEENKKKGVPSGNQGTSLYGLPERR